MDGELVELVVMVKLEGVNIVEVCEVVGGVVGGAFIVVVEDVSALLVLTVTMTDDVVIAI